MLLLRLMRPYRLLTIRTQALWSFVRSHVGKNSQSRTHQALSSGSAAVVKCGRFAATIEQARTTILRVGPVKTARGADEAAPKAWHHNSDAGLMGELLVAPSSHAPFASAAYGLQPLSMSKQECKVFVGGLSWETSDEKLR